MINLVILALAGLAAPCYELPVVTSMGRSLVESAPDYGKVREIVEIRDGHRFYPPQNLMPPQLASVVFRQNPGGAIRASIASAAPLALSSPSKAVAPSGWESLPLAEKENAARDFVRATYSRLPESSPSFSAAVTTVLRSPQLLNEPSNRGLVSGRSAGMELTNFNKLRYFWFRPDGLDQYFPGRVLDIHENFGSGRVSFLIEYLYGENPEGVRFRRIQQLNLSEFRTLRESEGGRGRREAEQMFFDSLSSEEIQTLKLAARFNLPLFAHTDAERKRRDPHAQSAFEKMNHISSIGIYSYLVETFGRFDDLLTPFEKSLTQFNVIDVFSRMHPKYVLHRFAGKKAQNTEFIWVITEDGALKVMPHLNDGNNLLPRLLRLAGGRRVFVAGVFFVGGKNLEVFFRSTGFDDSGFGIGGWFSENPHVEEFVKIVFGIQAGSKVAMSEERFSDSNRRENIFDDFFQEMEEWADRSTRKLKKITWDLEKGRPLEKAEFAEQLGLSEDDVLFASEWAHYVLQTDSQMSNDEVTKQYRRLAQKFHVDRPNKNKNAGQIISAVTEAFRIWKQKNSSLD